MNDSSFENLIRAYKKVEMTPEEKREVFKQSMLVIEKIEAVSLSARHNNEDFAKILGTGTNIEITTGGDRSNGPAFNKKSPIISTWITYIKKRQFIPALISAFVLLFTGGASMLADQALPGDSLYSFKLNVNEPIRELTAITNEAKAKLAVEVTERRLQEAAVLSAEGRLDENNKNILQDQFVKHADQIRNRVASLVASNNLGAAQEVVVDFESALKTHEIILEKLSVDSGDGVIAAIGTSTTAIAHNTASTSDAGVNTSGSTENIASSTQLATNIVPANTNSKIANAKRVNKAGVVSLLQAVKLELGTTKIARIGIDEKVMAAFANNSNVVASTSPLETTPMQVIESNIRELKFTISDIKNDISLNKYSTSTVALANKRLDIASTSLASIIDLLKKSQITEAASTSRATLQNLTELQTILKLDKGTKSLDTKIDFASLLNNDQEDKTNTATSTETTTSGSEKDNHTGSSTSATISQ